MASEDILQAEIGRRTAQGWEIVSRGATEAQMRRPKRFSFGWALLWFLLFGVGLLVYLVWHWLKAEQLAYLRVVDGKLVVSERLGLLGWLLSPVRAYWRWAGSRQTTQAKALAYGGPIVGVIALVIIIAVVAGGGGEEDEGGVVQQPTGSPAAQVEATATGVTGATTEAAETPTPGLPEHQGFIGEPVGSGKYQLTVTAVEDPYESGNQFIQPDAGKRFVVVHIELRNTGSSGSISIFPAWDVVVLDSTDLVHDADFMITEFSANELGAGERGVGHVGFEVPMDAQLSQIKLKLSFEKDIIIWLREP
jgi:hypothetical protein